MTTGLLEEKIIKKQQKVLENKKAAIQEKIEGDVNAIL